MHFIVLKNTFRSKIRPTIKRRFRKFRKGKKKCWIAEIELIAPAEDCTRNANPNSELYLNFEQLPVSPFYRNANKTFIGSTSDRENVCSVHNRSNRLNRA